MNNEQMHIPHMLKRYCHTPKILTTTIISRDEMMKNARTTIQVTNSADRNTRMLLKKLPGKKEIEMSPGIEKYPMMLRQCEICALFHSQGGHEPENEEDNREE